MESKSNYLINYLINKETFEKKLNRLTRWEQFLILLHLMGWGPSEISTHTETSKQAVGESLRAAKKKMGVYYQTLGDKQ